MRLSAFYLLSLKPAVLGYGAGRWLDEEGGIKFSETTIAINTMIIKIATPINLATLVDECPWISFSLGYCSSIFSCEETSFSFSIDYIVSEF